MEKSFEAVREAAKLIVVSKVFPEDHKAFRTFTDYLCEILDIELDCSVFKTRLDIAAEWGRRAVAVVSFLVVSYLVVGGVIATRSNPAVTILAVGALIVLLGAFEGLQISVTTLRMKSLDGLESKYRRALSLHSRFKSSADTRRFLAGRQLFVIVIVFVAAQLTSFSDLEAWPGTNRAFPSILQPWFPIIFLHLGIAGALFVLWFGQLAPQFIATRLPISFLNFPGMGLVLKASFFVEALGLTRPGDMLSARPRGQQDVPYSPRELYGQFAQLLGYALFGQRKRWNVFRDRVELVYEGSTVLLKDTFESVVDANLQIRGDGALLGKFSAQLIPDDPTQIGVRQALSEPVEEERIGNGWRRCKQIARCSHGNFKENDVIVFNSHITFPFAAGDAIHVVHPTKYLLLTVTFQDSPRRCSAKMRCVAKDDTLGTAIELDNRPLDIKYNSNGDPYVEIAESFPATNRLYFLDWEVEY